MPMDEALQVDSFDLHIVKRWAPISKYHTCNGGSISAVTYDTDVDAVYVATIAQSSRHGYSLQSHSA